MHLKLRTGVYTTVFGLYVRLTWETRTPLVVVDYGVILVFVLSVITIGVDATQQFFTLVCCLYPNYMSTRDMFD
jgi:hypothetical protein